MDDPQSVGALTRVANQVSADTGQKVLQWKMNKPVKIHKRVDSVAMYKIAAHFQFVMQQAFEVSGHTHLIMLEDDLEVMALTNHPHSRYHFAFSR